ncbi:MAG: hypothetical protein WAO20_05405, partial [Acidobacteriota bacterium]
PNYLDYAGGFARWDTSQSIPFKVDNGPLKKAGTTVVLSRDQGRQIIDDETARWTDVSTSTFAFRDSGFLAVDITAANYLTQLPNIASQNPVIFDADGSIVDDMFGTGSKSSVLGFAGVLDIVNDQCVSGWAVMNGFLVSPQSLGELRQTVMHEFGHFIGLDHSMGLLSNWQQGDFADVPVMFPLGGEAGLPAQPITDDIAWISWLYPTAGLAQQTGTIKGHIYWLRQGGPVFQGANVEAIPAIPDGNGGFTESRGGIVTCVSDFLATGTGEYELPNLAPGDYYVRIEQIPMTISGVSITGGSGIGPFDSRPTGFPTDYYDPDESVSEDPALKTVIHVEAGQIVTGIDLVPNDTTGLVQLTPDDTSGVQLVLDDDDSRLVIFPNNFVFSFFGRAYHEVYVNSDGNLTFETGDSSSTARDETRFLSGPPRIAPLFTDLNPAGGGQVVASVGAGFVRFSWQGVPEFVDTGTAPGNSFIVTLNSNGDIRFDYGQIQVSVDSTVSDPQTDPQAIVGVSPGHVTSGVTKNLASSVDFQMGQEAIYQVFFDIQGRRFNLSNRPVSFLASSSELLFPFLSGGADEFTGIAITDYGTEDALLAADARGDDGNLMVGDDNPATVDLPAGTQYAALGREPFGLGGGQSFGGWARIRSDHPEVASFFQFGNGLSSGTVTQMDGSAAFTTQAKKLYFTRLYQGPDVFPSYAGFLDAVTWISLVNPNDTPISLTLRLYAATGQPIGDDVARTVPANGRVYETLASLFNLQTPVGDGYVQVTVDDGPGAIGFELVQLPDALLGLNAAFDNPSDLAYSAQLGHSQDVFTSLKVINPTDSSINIQVTAYIQQPNGSINQIPKVFALNPHQALQQNVENLFALGPGGTTQIVGSIKVQATGVIGDVVFGDPQTAKFVAALPLQTQLFRKAVNGQVSNGRYPSNPALNSFTGIALFNPGVVAAQVTVEVYDRNGVKQGEKTLTLQSNQRISKVLYESDFIPESLGLVRGYVVITSNQPIVAQELFGNDQLDYLSAVVPTVIQ